MIAETVVGLSSVRSQISTRAIGPKRRIASITWKRLIARMNSGSAVFMIYGAEGELELFPIPTKSLVGGSRELKPSYAQLAESGSLGLTASERCVFLFHNTKKTAIAVSSERFRQGGRR